MTATCEHEIVQLRSPINIKVVCTCGWSCTISRRQNAMARASKVRAAIAEHDRSTRTCECIAATGEQK